jgi:hypothetical protein
MIMKIILKQSSYMLGALFLSACFAIKKVIIIDLLLFSTVKNGAAGIKNS